MPRVFFTGCSEHFIERMEDVNFMKPFMKLYIPIALETLFTMLAGMVDTVMLSTVGDNAVGAVGTANTDRKSVV